MKIDFQCPDSLSNIRHLQGLLQTVRPTDNDVIMSTLFASMIFYENRPGKLAAFPGYNIYGTGCHNPTSEKTGEIIWQAWRLEVIIQNDRGLSIVIKREVVHGGHLRAVLKNGKITRVISADIFPTREKGVLRATSVRAKHRERFMRALQELLTDPLNALLKITESETIAKAV